MVPDTGWVAEVVVVVEVESLVGATSQATSSFTAGFPLPELLSLLVVEVEVEVVEEDSFFLVLLELLPLLLLLLSDLVVFTFEVEVEEVVVVGFSSLAESVLLADSLSWLLLALGVGGHYIEMIWLLVGCFGLLGTGLLGLHSLFLDVELALQDQVLSLSLQHASIPVANKTVQTVLKLVRGDY